MVIFQKPPKVFLIPLHSSQSQFEHPQLLSTKRHIPVFLLLLTSMSKGEGILVCVVSLITVEDVRIEIGWNGEGWEKPLEAFEISPWFCPLLWMQFFELFFTPPGWLCCLHLRIVLWLLGVVREQLSSFPSWLMLSSSKAES